MSQSSDQGAARRQLMRVLTDALENGATVLHVEPEGSGARLRARSALELREFRMLSREEYADLWQNIADRFGGSLMDTFFEGSFPFMHAGRACHVRVSMVPTPSGESITLKINTRDAKVRALDALGLSQGDLERYRTLLAAGRGLVVLASASGGGSSTALASTLAHLGDGTRKLISVEDPIEIPLEGVQQIELKLVRDHPERSVTFDRALRAAQLQNCDVIGIGHLRDADATRAALDAALSGALTISRVQAPTAAVAVSRLLSLSPDGALLADSLRAVLAQALVRRNCPECAGPEDPAPFAERAVRAGARDLLGRSRAGRGCHACQGLGTIGLVPVFELMVCTAPLGDLMVQRRPVGELHARAVSDGMVSLEDTIREMVVAGSVGLADYLRCV